MSKDNEQKEQEKGKTLSLSGKTLQLKKTVESGQIRQSFSHGRSKTVTVEVRRKRLVNPKDQEEGEGSTSGIQPGSQIPEGFTEAEWQARLKAVQAAESRGEDDSVRAKIRATQEKLEVENAQRLLEEREHAKKLQEEGEKRKQALLEKKKASKPTEEQSSIFEEVDEEEGQGLKKHAKNVLDEVEEEEEEEEHKKVKKTLSVPKRNEARQKLHRLTLEEILEEEVLEEPVAEVEEVDLPQPKPVYRPKKKVKRSYEGPQKIIREVALPDTISVQELASRMAVRAGEVIKTLLTMGLSATINQSLDADTAELVINELGHKVKRVTDATIEEKILISQDEENSLKPRAPVVTVMGHVDHGKTSLLDAIRQSDVVSKEAGGITQHIGAYQVTVSSGQKVTFIDTPGHAAFTEMRARGANVTDIVILVVAADDGIKDQTIEAIHHAKAANVPMIVAINKIDKPDANVERVRNELLQQGLVPEELGGDIQTVEVSARNKTNIDKLLEAILLQAEMLNLRANPDRVANGTVVESKVEHGRGAVATILIQGGTLKVGHIFVAGEEWGRVRALRNDKGQALKEALPSMPVEVLGFAKPPVPGDQFVVVENEAQAREVTELRTYRKKEAQAQATRKLSLEQLLTQGPDVARKELAIVVKTDVQGSLEAILGSFGKIENPEVSVRILHSGVGPINESDVSLSSASKGFVIGFNVRATPQAREQASKGGVELRYYSIIYDVLDDVKALLGGLLSPTLRENYLGSASIRQVFSVTKSGKIAGCKVSDGVVKRGAKVRLLRDNVVIHEGLLKTLKRFKDEVKEVKEGYECGMSFENYQDIREGDVIECYEIQEMAREL